jgi:hypothetical protein
MFWFKGLYPVTQVTQNDRTAKMTPSWSRVCGLLHKLHAQWIKSHEFHPCIPLVLAGGILKNMILYSEIWKTLWGIYNCLLNHKNKALTNKRVTMVINLFKQSFYKCPPRNDAAKFYAASGNRILDPWNTSPTFYLEATYWETGARRVESKLRKINLSK